MSKGAEEYFLEGRGCAQSVLASCAERVGLDGKTALKISAPFGGGVGRMRHICGALSGALMAAGLRFADEDASKEKKEKIYALTRKIADEFKSRNGSIMCAEILASSGADTDSSHVPQERTKEYYAARECCLKAVRSAEEIVDTFFV